MSIFPRHGKICLFFLTCTFFCRSAFPQQDVPSTKPAPGAHWIVTYEKKEKEPSDKPAKPRSKHKDKAAEKENAETGGLLQSEEYSITPEVACVTKKYADGSERAIYIVNGVAYQKRTGAKNVAALSTSGTNNGDIIFTEHYPGCDWLQAQYYVNTEKQGEHSCLHFRKPATSKAPAETDLQAYDAFLTYLDREAWIDAETGLPVPFRQGTIFGTYQHEPALEEPISLPEEIAQAVKRYNGEN